jgi:hypothetical protein
MNSFLFKDMTTCNLLKISRRFGITGRFNLLQGGRISRGRNEWPEKSVGFQRATLRYISEDRTEQGDYDHLGLKDNIKIGLREIRSVGSIELAQDGAQWRTLVNVWVP